MPSNAGRDLLSLAGAAGLGAAAMYFLDPARGTRRRHMLTDKLAHTRRTLGEGVRTTGTDLRNRAVGITARARRRLTTDDAGDEVVAERVRAELGRAVSHPQAIDVSVTDGRLSLMGVVLTDEAECLLRHVHSVRGVHAVEDRLERHETADDVPGLQGSGRPPGPRFELLREHWNPTARLLTGVTGGALVVGGLAHGGRAGWPVGLTGLTLLARAVVNEPIRKMTDLVARSAGMRVRHAIEIAAPADVVFDYVTDWQRWPEWVPNVRRVTRVGGDRDDQGDVHANTESGPPLETERARWEVVGPDDSGVTWDAVTTRFVENESVSWRSGEGPALQHAGTLRLAPRDGDRTRLQIDLSFDPVVGRVAEPVAVLFGPDPGRQTQIALERLKSVIETGAVPRERIDSSGTGSRLRRWKKRLR